MASTPSQRMGPPPRNLPTGQARGLKAHVDAHGCIMVRSAPDPQIQECRRDVPRPLAGSPRIVLGNVTVTIDNRSSACPDPASALPR
jgi:hypothetical protein